MAESTMEYPVAVPESPAAEGASGATDELLSQLAGEEIDRLLAEADVQRTAPAEPAPAAAPTDASTPFSPTEPPAVADGISIRGGNAAPTVAAAMTALGSEAVPASAEIAPPAPSLSEPTDPAPVQEKLLPDLDAPRAEQAIADLVGPIDPELDEATREPADEERAGLDLALGPAVAQLEAEDALDAAQLLDEGARPWYLRPLDQLDQALAAIPEGVLEILGKIAILTTVNAIAVLAYVLFFRHH